jgi:hypothetical protein
MGVGNTKEEREGEDNNGIRKKTRNIHLQYHAYIYKFCIAKP